MVWKYVFWGFYCTPRPSPVNKTFLHKGLSIILIFLCSSSGMRHHHDNPIGIHVFCQVLEGQRHDTTVLLDSSGQHLCFRHLVHSGILDYTLGYDWWSLSDAGNFISLEHKLKLLISELISQVRTLIKVLEFHLQTNIADISSKKIEIFIFPFYHVKVSNTFIYGHSRAHNLYLGT